MHDSPEVFLSVIVPAYNEVDRIGETVRRILRFLESRDYPAELIVVVDGGRAGSAARTLTAAEGSRSKVTVLDNGENRGKGFSVRRGVSASRGRYVLFADADLSLPIEGSDRFLQALESGYDVAIASRALPDSVERGGRQPLRYALGRTFNWVVQRMLLPGIRDTQCGFKAFHGPAARRIFELQKVDRFGFDVELLRIARRLEMRIIELPVVCEYHASSSVRRLQDGVAMLSDLAVIIWNEWRGNYDPRS